MSEITTEAGRRLLAEEDFTLDGIMPDPALAASIAAIEAEARADGADAERVRLAEAVRGMFGAGFGHSDPTTYRSVPRAAVLALLEEDA